MDNDCIDSWEVGDLTIEIHREEYPEDPREWDNLGTMVCFHRNYRLGDKHDYPAPESLSDLERIIEEDNGPCLFKTLWLLDHSGLAMRTTDFWEDSGHWDSGIVGVIYVPLSKVREEYSVKRVTKKVRDQALSCLEGEVIDYNNYLQGNVYGYVIRDKDGEHVDSCWGYFPDRGGDGLEYLRKEATEIAEYIIKKRADKERE